MQTLDILERLIAFPTISSDPNRALIDYCAALLRGAGADVQIINDPHQDKANLYATFGPRDVPGVMLSGHTDVVPVEGQEWSVPPFAMTCADAKVYGRGATDMKGFVACVLAAISKADQSALKTPLHVALSYDEEIGCLGVRSLIDMLQSAPIRPRFCIVGEPTLMGVATGHKGKTALRATCRGREAHSALAPTGLNAIHLANDLIHDIRTLQTEVAESGQQDDDFDVPYTTLHVGKISGGVALNIVPNTCALDFEIRNILEDDPKAVLERLNTRIDARLKSLRDKFPEAAIEIETTNTYPPLGTEPDADVVGFVKSLTGTNTSFKVAFGTEGGLFSQDLGIATVICGPGSMAQGHKPDEFVSLDQLRRCDEMLAALIARLSSGGI